MTRFSLVLASLLALLAPAAQAVTCMNNLPASNPDSAYIVHGDGTATDTRTNLMWKVCAEGQSWSNGTCTSADSATSHTWAAALALAESTVFAGHSDWRLPNLKELRSLVEECRVNPSINDSVFPSAPSSAFWPGSPYAYYSYVAWYVYFGNGYAGLNGRDYAYHVRLVRGGQSSGALTLAIPPAEKVGKSFTIATKPVGGQLGTCTSSNTAVATVSGATVSVVGRGTATISCNGMTAQVRGVQPQVLSIAPTTVYLGETTEFEVVGTDLDLMMEFELGGGWYSTMCTAGLQSNPNNFVMRDSSMVRHFTCVPEGNPGTYPAHLWLVGDRSKDFLTSTLGVQTQIQVVQAPISADEAAKRAAFAAMIAKYGVGGEIPWRKLNFAQLADIQATLRNAGVDTSYPPELRRALDDVLAKIDLEFRKNFEAIGGVYAGYQDWTWQLFVPGSNLWWDWGKSTRASYTVMDHLKVLGGIALYGTQAVIDASGGSKGVAKLLKRRPVKFPNLLGRNFPTRVVKAIRNIESWQGKLAVGVLDGTLQLSAEEKQGALEIYEDFKGVGIELASENFAQLLSNGTEFSDVFWAKFILGAMSNLPAYLLGKEVPAAAVRDYLGEIFELSVSALPVASAWKDMWDLSTKVAEGTNARWYGQLYDINQTAQDQSKYARNSFMAVKLSRLFDAHENNTGINKQTKALPFTRNMPAQWQAHPSSIKRFVLVTHGWNSSAAAWPDELVRALCDKAGGVLQTETASGDLKEQGISKWCESSNWLIASYDWKVDSSWHPLWNGYLESENYLDRSPPEALTNAKHHGDMFELTMRSIGLAPDVVHLIGHSAGSGFVENLSERLRETKSSITIHSTFLDAFCPDPDGCKYGEKATWAEQYVDSRYSLDGDVAFVVGPRETNVTLPAAYSFDVTALDPSGTVSPTAHHAHPYKMYIASAVKNTPLSGDPPLLTKIGANLAAEYVGAAGPATHITAQKMAYPPGYRCTLVSGNETSTNDLANCANLSTFVGTPITRDTGTGNYKPGNVTYSTCAHQTTGAGTLINGVGIVTCSQTPDAARTKSEIQTDIQADPPAIAVSTLRYTVTVPANSNQLAFSYRFTNAAAAGSIQVFVDDDMIFASTQAIDGVLLRSTGWLAVPLLVPGTHSIQVVLKSSNGVNAALEFGSVQFANRSIGMVTVPTDGLVGYWSFDNNDAALTSGTANSGQLSGGVSFGPGKFGNAATFGGVDNPGHIRIPNSSALQFTTGATYSVWVRVDSLRGLTGNYEIDPTGNAYSDTIWAKSHDVDGAAMMVKYDASDRGFAWLGSYQPWVAQQPRLWTPTKRAGDWMHVVVTLSSTAGSKIYIDGLLYSQGSAPVSFATMNAEDLYLGKFSDAWYPLHGALDELRIYNRVLSEAEIGQLAGTFSQSISFGTVTNLYPGATTSLNVTASSGLPVSLSSLTPTVCTLSGTTLTTLTAGTCTISATQAGNQRYDAAADTLSLPVGQLGQYILSGTVPRLHKGGTAQLNATGGNSGNPVTYRSATMDICTVSGTNGSTVAGVKEGACVILANQAGNASYRAANQSTLTLDVMVPAVPTAPQLVRLVAGNDSIRAVFNPPTSDGGYAISSYTLTCSGNGVIRTATGSGSPLTVTGLTYGQTYACSLVAANTMGNSASSVPVNQVVKRSVSIAPILNILLD